MHLADFLVVVRQRADHFSGLLEFLVHARDCALVSGIGQFRRDPADRDVQSLDIALQRQVGLRCADSRFLDGAGNDRPEASRSISHQLHNRIEHGLIEPGGRILHADVQIIMINEGLIVRVRQARAVAHHVRHETCALWHGHIGIA